MVAKMVGGYPPRQQSVENLGFRFGVLGLGLGFRVWGLGFRL
jgi:hypothetical protein